MAKFGALKREPEPGGKWDRDLLNALVNTQLPNENKVVGIVQKLVRESASDSITSINHLLGDFQRYIYQTLNAAADKVAEDLVDESLWPDLDHIAHAGQVHFAREVAFIETAIALYVKSGRGEEFDSQLTNLFCSLKDAPRINLLIAGMLKAKRVPSGVISACLQRFIDQIGSPPSDPIDDRLIHSYAAILENFLVPSADALAGLLKVVSQPLIGESERNLVDVVIRAVADRDEKCLCQVVEAMIREPTNCDVRALALAIDVASEISEDARSKLQPAVSALSHLDEIVRGARARFMTRHLATET